METILFLRMKKNNEVTNTKIINSGKDREISRVSCEGFVNVVFHSF